MDANLLICTCTCESVSYIENVFMATHNAILESEGVAIKALIFKLLLILEH